MDKHKKSHKIKYIVMSIFLIIAIIASAAMSNLNAYNLPDIGSNTELTLSYQDEKLLGEYIYKDLVKQLPVERNPFLEEYIQNLGEKLLKNSESHYNQFQFFIVDSKLINAFAMPGGYIGVNKGLITSADNENEVASVLAHEISHVTQRHIARSFEKQKQMHVPMIAGIIVGALLTAYSPEIGQSIIAGTMAAGTQSALNYTRSNEKEADRIGMQILQDSGYPPEAMAEFFNKLQKYAYADKDFFPEYLRTHPVNQSRIADARNRAHKINKLNTNKLVNNSFEFNIVKNILVINSEQNLIKIIENNLDAIKLKKANEKYTLEEINLHKFNAAFAMLKNHDYKKANLILNELNKKYPKNNIIASLLAESYRTDANKALRVLEQQLEISKNSVPLSIQYSKAAMVLKKNQQAINKLKQVTKSKLNYNPEIDLLLAENYNKLGKKWHASMAYANYSIKHGDLQAALMQLKASAKFDKLNNYQSKITSYKIKDLEAQYKLRKDKLKQWL